MKQRILYILGEYPSLTESFIKKEILYMHQKGSNIMLFSLCQREKYTKFKENDFQCFYPKWFNIIFYFKLSRILLFNLWYNTSKPIKQGGNCQNIRDTIQKIKQTFIAICVIEVVRKYNATHLHAHFASYPTDIALLASEMLNIPFSFSAHARDIYTQTNEELANKIEKAKFVVTCTRYNYDYLTSISRRIQDNSKIHCIYHGINSDEWKFSPPSIKKHKGIIINILTVARLVEKKGLFFLIEALEILTKRDYPVNCTIIGSGPLSQKLNRLIVSKNIAQDITILSKQSPKEIAHHFYKNDFFVLPCLIANNGDRDGLPNVLLEALASGIPVITTPVSAIPELIQDNKTGFFVPERSSTAIADSICNLIEQPELCRTVAFNGMQKVKAEFDSSFWGDRLYQLFISELITVD